MSSSKVKYVDHTYRDFSRFIDEGGELIKHKKSNANFPAKLHKMLSEPRHSHAIAWMPHGRAWKILDKDVLFASVIPQYYVCKKYESFTRQLNGWGFKRLYQTGPDLGCFYHECFLRGLPKLTCLVRRLPTSQGKSTPFPAGEPNFYRISETHPLPDTDPPDASAESPAEAEEGGDGTTIVLDTPRIGDALSNDLSQSEIEHPSLSSLPTLNPINRPPSAFQESATAALLLHQGSSNQESTVALAAATPSAAPSHKYSSSIHPPSFPLTRPTLTHEYSAGFEAGLAAAAANSAGFEAGLAVAAARPNESSGPVPHYTPRYVYQTPSDHRSYPHPRPHSTHGPLSFGDYGQPHHHNYVPYSNQGQPPQYKYPPSERPRFRYPPPVLPRNQYPPPPNYHYPYSNPINEFLSQPDCQHSQESNLNQTPVMLPPSDQVPAALPPLDSHASNVGNDSPPDPPADKNPERSPTIEPLPYYSPRLDGEKRKANPPEVSENLNRDSPVQKKRKAEDHLEDPA